MLTNPLKSWCLGRELNPHSHLGPRDFKSKNDQIQKSTIAVLWRKYLILASNMALKCAFS